MRGYEAIPVNKDSDEDKNLIETLIGVAKMTGKLVAQRPIRRPRPNEVGNDIETYVMAAAHKLGFSATLPIAQSGKKKSTGYLDILLIDEKDRATYLECKIFTEGSAQTTMRSFYLSPSEDFKVSRNARHLLMAFGVAAEAIAGSRDSFYHTKSFKLVDLYGLKCDVKYEFNSDNTRLYEERHIFAQGDL
jgi:hypothetical protein